MKESKKEKAGNKEYDLKALDKSRTKARENFEHVKNTQELCDAKILDKPRTKVRGESWTSKNPKQTSAFKPRYTQGFFDNIFLGGLFQHTLGNLFSLRGNLSLSHVFAS